MRLFRPTQDDIRASAANWSIRIATEALSPRDWDHFDAWMHADPRHAAEFKKGMLVWQQLEEIASTSEILSYRAGALSALRRAGRFRWAQPYYATWQVGAALAASLVLVLLSAVYLLASPVQAYDGGLVAAHHVVLADGTQVDLAPQARIAVDFEPGLRTITLLNGTAQFATEADTRRPMVVVADGAVVMTNGARFAAGLTIGDLKLKVEDGTVALLSGGSVTDSVLPVATLASGQAATFRLSRSGLGVQSDLGMAWGGIPSMAGPLADVFGATASSRHSDLFHPHI